MKILKAARLLRIAEQAMTEAAAALCEIGSDEAKLHSSEMLGACKMLRRWELELRRSVKHAPEECRGRG